MFGQSRQRTTEDAMTSTSQAKKRQKKSFNAIVDGVQALYPEPLPQAEAEEAAHNLIRFCRLLVKVKQEQLRKEQKQPKSEGGSP